MESWVSATRFSELVGLIYDCATDPALWPAAMEAIRVELDFHNATLDLIQLPSGTALSNVVCNVPPEYLTLMADGGPDVIGQWGGAQVVQSLPLDRPAVLTHVNPAFDAQTTTNPYYLAFAKPQGIIDALAIPLARDTRAIGSVAFGRHQSAGPIGAREIAIAHMLVPHLQRATTINRMLEGAAVRQAGFADTLEAIAIPIVVVGADQCVLHANAAAERLIATQTLIRTVFGRLEATTPGASSALSAALARPIGDGSLLGRRGLGIPIVKAGGTSGALHVLPLRGERAEHGNGAVAAVFVAEMGTPFVNRTDIAAALFDLTPTESRVFNYLVNGYTQATAAVALGVERSTIKTHLTRLYNKIGVRRQADLVRIAASLAVPIVD